MEMENFFIEKNYLIENTFLPLFHPIKANLDWIDAFDYTDDDDEISTIN